MRARSEALALRRELLLARITLQRMELQEAVLVLGEAASPWAAVRRWTAGWREHPSRLLMLAGLLMGLRRIGLRRVTRHALTAWRVWRTMGF